VKGFEIGIETILTEEGSDDSDDDENDEHDGAAKDASTTLCFPASRECARVFVFPVHLESYFLRDLSFGCHLLANHKASQFGAIRRGERSGLPVLRYSLS